MLDCFPNTAKPVEKLVDILTRKVPYHDVREGEDKCFANDSVASRIQTWSFYPSTFAGFSHGVNGKTYYGQFGGLRIL
jgi:hypothetical protein